MIFLMEDFKKPPFVKGVTTMEEFFEDQHRRRRFLGKYSPKVFPKVKKCKNEMCTSYHDNKDSYCSLDCRVIWEMERMERRYTKPDSEMGHLRCGNCRYYVPHHTGFKAFKGHCVEDMHHRKHQPNYLVAADHWCHFFMKQETKRNRQ